jgi:hypothetical protein
MPPRWLSLPIVLFWLTTTGWLLYQDVWPLLLPNQAPPYTIDLEDEVQSQQALPLHIHWSVFYNDRPYLRAETWVSHSAKDDTFTLGARITPRSDPAKVKEADAGADPFAGVLQIGEAESQYQVARNGDLQAVSFKFAGEARLKGLVIPGQGLFSGVVHDGALNAHLHAESAVLAGKPIDVDLDPMPMSRHGSVLSPLHPVNRIEGLRPGQTWRLPLVDPLKTAFGAILKKYLGVSPGEWENEIVVTAQVLPQKQMFTWNQKQVECLVIQYNADDVSAKTWVEADTGRVLCQESERGGEHVVLLRD